MTSPIDFKFRAFLSYSHADTAWARFLHKRIEGFPLRDLAGRATARGTVPKRLAPVFRDREDFTAGHSLGAQTLAALDASAALIVLCSPAAAKSHYVNEEIRLFKWKHAERLVIPVIADGKPGDPARECFPPALRFKVAADGTVTDAREPDMLAADLREEGDGRELALAKVVASLTGLTPLEVTKRLEDDARRTARIRNAVIALILAISGGAAYFIFSAQKRGAILIDTAAACARYQPQGKSASAGPLNALEQCINSLEAMRKGAANDPRDAEILKLIEQGKKDDAERLQVEALQDDEAAGIARNKSAAQRARGIAATAGLADPKKAREYYARAAKLDPDHINGMFWHAYMEQETGNLALAERAYNIVTIIGSHPEHNFELYWARLGLGDIKHVRGSLQDALTAYREASTDADRLAKADPQNAGWQRALSVSNERLGDIYLDLGNLGAALDQYLASLKRMVRIRDAYPTNADLQRFTSVTLNKIGDVLVAQDNLSEALKFFHDSLAIRNRLAKAHPKNATLQRDLAVSNNRIGRVLENQGNLPDALKSFRDSLAIADRLAKADANNAGWQYDLGFSNERIGDVQMAQGDLAAAMKSYEAKRDIISRLAKADPKNAQWQRALSVSYNKVGDVLVAQDKLPEALKAFKDSLNIADRLANADPKNAELQRDLAVSYFKLSTVYRKQNDMAKVREALVNGRDIMERMVKLSPDNAEWKRNLATFEAQIAALEK